MPSENMNAAHASLLKTVPVQKKNTSAMNSSWKVGFSILFPSIWIGKSICPLSKKVKGKLRSSDKQLFQGWVLGFPSTLKTGVIWK